MKNFRFYTLLLIAVVSMYGCSKDDETNPDGFVKIDNTTGSLSEKIANPTEITLLSITGSISDEDFKFIREKLTSLEVLDLSKTRLTVLPKRALAFYSSMELTDNTSLKKVILPETLTTIGESAFAMCTALEHINIPSRVNTLSRWMFEECEKLAIEIKIPDGVTAIPASAFYKSGFSSIQLPNSVTSIGSWAFQYCTNLESINIPTGVSVLSKAMFTYCANLKQVSWHNNITSIEDDVFNQCKKLQPKQLTLPANLTSIGMRAFSTTGLTSVKFPEGLKSIDNAAFSQCMLETVDLPSTITSMNTGAFDWSVLNTFICRSTTPPAMPDRDEYNNKYQPFYKMKESCLLKIPAGSDYSTWSTYFGERISEL